MLPVLIHSYLCLYILSGPLFLFVQPLSPGLYNDGIYESEAGVTVHSAVSTPAYLRESLSNDSVSCEDLQGVGSFDTTCLLNSNLYVDSDLHVFGTGNVKILPNVSVACPVKGCLINVNISGTVFVGQYAAIVAGSIIISAANLTVGNKSSINSTSLGGLPPSATSGTPVGYDGAGGGHGGRGASCLKSNRTNFWGGDVYAWSTLSRPWSYGSKGSGTSDEHKFGGSGGGRVMLEVKDTLFLDGYVNAEGGDGGTTGGGGSGGSIIINAPKLKGDGIVSAAGGRGWGGGGGGRISINCYSRQEEVKVTVHGGLSIGCPWNSGAAGTFFDASIRNLRVGNENITTETETPLLDFPTSPLWSNVYVENNAIVLVPLRWTRVQVRGQISLLSGSIIIFGLAEDPISEFEVVAEELLMSYSSIRVYGALRVSVKMLLMLKSQMQIDGGGTVTTSVLELRNLAVLNENSVISSNKNLAIYGQGYLKLTGHGDAIKGQRLSLSLFYNITVGSGSLLQAPLDDDSSKNMVTKSLCESPSCPVDLIFPPDDCHVNYTLSFSLQICRVEDILVNGIVKGSIIHIHRARVVIVDTGGMLSASEFGCRKGVGKGNYSNGAGGGAGHGGRGGSGSYNGKVTNGGDTYGDAYLPCELGSGTEGPNDSTGNIAGGGIIVLGSKPWPLLRLQINGTVRANGQSVAKSAINSEGTLVGGLGGGSGGTVLLFLQELALEDNSSLSVSGGYGGPCGGGGGGGGRVHFHWSKIATGNEYVPLATIRGAINNSGGAGDGGGLSGQKGTVTGRDCPKGLFGTFCEECPIGTYKDIEGSNESLCIPCSLKTLPNRASFIYMRGGVTQSTCPYKCISEKYQMPNCYTPLEELYYVFGGPWPFSFLSLGILGLLALLLNTLRIKLVGSRSPNHSTNSMERQSHHHFPHLLSLSEVRGARTEETQSHVHRMYFMGPDTFREPWHLPYSPPNAIIEIVYEDAYNRFIDEINSVAAYNWWEGSVHSILSLLAYPCAWSWKQWRKRNKIHRLQEYVKSEYDHSCLRSCRSRALYKGMKVGTTPDLLVAYIDFFLGGEEKHVDMVKIIQKRFPMCIIFGGDGSYMSPYNVHTDFLLTNLLGQHVPGTVWNRFVKGLNAQLRTVRHGSIRSGLILVLDWIRSHGNPQLEFHGVRIELGWFQATTTGYYQLGILVIIGDYSLQALHEPAFSDRSHEEYLRNATAAAQKTQQLNQSSLSSHVLSRKKISGGINGGLINEATVKSLDYRKDFLFPFSLFLHNTRPVGREENLQLLISFMLLADIFVTLLVLVQFYWICLGAFLAVLLILPLSLLSPFPAGLNALLSKDPRRASLSRVYALWNATSLSNIVVAFICGICYFALSYLQPPEEANMRKAKREDDRWWLLPTILLLIKCIQARFVDWHIANIEVSDFSLFCPDPDAFWAHEFS